MHSITEEIKNLVGTIDRQGMHMPSGALKTLMAVRLMEPVQSLSSMNHLLVEKLMGGIDKNNAGSVLRAIRDLRENIEEVSGVLKTLTDVTDNLETVAKEQQK